MIALSFFLLMGHLEALLFFGKALSSLDPSSSRMILLFCAPYFSSL
jgi:hypothetical protein